MGADRPHAAGKVSDPGRTAAYDRLFVSAVLRVLRSAARWSDLPERHGCFQSVHEHFTTWSRAGVFQVLSRDRDND